MKVHANRGLALAGLLGLAAVVVVVILRRPSGEEEEEETPPAVRVEIAKAEVKTLEVKLDVLGRVEPRPGHVAEIAAPGEARVTRIEVAVGDRVAAGQPLVRLDASVWSAQRHQAEVGLATAQQAFERAQRLQAEGIAPRKDVESAAAELARARAELEEATRLERLATLRSPIAGVVVEVNASLERPVDPSTVVVEVIDPAGLEVVFQLAPDAAARVARGAAVELSTEQDGGRALVGRGRVTGISAEVDSASGSVKVRAALATTFRALRAGEAVYGRILVESLRGVVVVPIAALVPDGEATQVFVVAAGGIAHATPVTVGSRNDVAVQILSGLRGGETVVTRGAYGLLDGARVELATDSAAPAAGPQSPSPAAKTRPPAGATQP